MDKLRTIKNRLSVSVDKLSPGRRGRSPNKRRSIVFGGDSSISSSNIISEASTSPGRPARRNRNRSVRPNSFDESDVDEVINSADNSFLSTSGDVLDSPLIEIDNPLFQIKSQIVPCLTEKNSDTDKSITPTKIDSGNESLVSEVMKEFQRRENNCDLEHSETKKESLNFAEGSMKKLEDKLDFIDNADGSDEAMVQKPVIVAKNEKTNLDVSSESMLLSSTSEKLLTKSSAENIVSGSSNLNAESMTSGYFSDSTSETSNITKPKIYATVFSTLSKIEDKPPSKKESIYSRLIKKKDPDKETSVKKTKEPLYARIKPKLKLDTGFKPIEPESSVTTSPVIKPEPIYSKVKPRTPVSPVTSPSSSICPIFSPGSPRSSFSPLHGNVEPIYSKVKPKSSTLPPITSHSYLPQIQSKTFPRDIPLESPRAKYPIYTQPLPALPSENEDDRSRPTKPSTQNYNCDKVTVRATEISPVRANVITISNPVYIPSPPSSRAALPEPLKLEGSLPSISSSTALTINGAIPEGTPPVSPPFRRAKASRSNLSSSSSEKLSLLSTMSMMLPVKAANTQKEKAKADNEMCNSSVTTSRDDLMRSESFLTINSDSDVCGRTLSRLVEELAVELETVSRRLGNQVCTDDDSKKQVLSKLLATYDIPKNLRRVPEVDEEEVLRSERYLLPISSANDLNDEHVDTFYGDVPNYSQDEFVIALDDENDPKYASLTREMRQQQRGVVDMSPGKVSRRSAQVYVNVINVLSALKVLVNSNSTKAAGVVQRMGSLARPYAKKVQTTVQTSVHSSVQDTTWIQRRIFHATVSFIKIYHNIRISL